MIHATHFDRRKGKEGSIFELSHTNDDDDGDDDHRSRLNACKLAIDGKTSMFPRFKQRAKFFSSHDELLSFRINPSTKAAS